MVELAYQPIEKTNNKFVEQARNASLAFYSVSVSRSATTLGTASVTVPQDFIATFINFTGYVEAFDAHAHTRDYTFLLNGVTMMKCTVANASPVTEYQDKANEIAYLPDITILKGSTISIVCGGSTGNTNSGTFILGGHLKE